MDIYEKLVQRRKEFGLSQREVATLANLSAPTIAKIEKGEDVAFSTVMKMAGALDLSLTLVDREEEFERELAELQRKKAELDAEIEKTVTLINTAKSKRKR